MKLSAAVAAAAVLLSGCVAKDPPDDDSPAVVDSRDIAAAIAEAQCARIFDCCATGEIEDVFIGIEVATVEECGAALQANADAFLIPSLDTAQAAGTVIVNENALPACADAIANESCEAFEPVASVTLLGRPGCESVVEPQLTLSAFCTEDFECDTGFCSRASGMAEGACKHPPDAGEPCLNERCGEGLYCGTDETCAEKLGDEADCTRNAECASDNCVVVDEQMICQPAPRICTE